MAQILKFTSKKAKEYALKQRFIAYFDTINQGRVSIPSFMLAEQEVNRLKNQGMIDFCYRQMISKGKNYGT